MREGRNKQSKEEEERQRRKVKEKKKKTAKKGRLTYFNTVIIYCIFLLIVS